MQSLRNKIILILFNPAPNPLCQVWVKISLAGGDKGEGEGDFRLSDRLQGRSR